MLPVRRTVGARGLLASCLITMCMAVGHASAQALKTPDPHPLDRPKPVSSIKGSEIRSTLQTLASTLQTAGFQIDQANWDTGEILAKRTVADGENRIVLQLEWDLGHPGERFNIYVSTGRFEKFFGGTDLRRVVLSTTEESQYFGPVRQALITEALRGG